MIGGGGARRNPPVISTSASGLNFIYLNTENNNSKIIVLFGQPFDKLCI